MKEDIAKAWIHDLRTTDAPQAHGYLYDGAGYCCLGRLCVVLGHKFEERPLENGTRIENHFYVEGIDEFTTVLPPSIQKEASMDTATGELGADIQLTAENDNGKTFSQIADMIEANWERL